MKEKQKSHKTKIITYQPEAFGTVDIKSDITEHPKTSHKLPKTIRKDEKVSYNSSLHIDTKSKTFLNEKNEQKKNMLLKAMQVFSTYNVEILNSFNPELQPKDTEFAIRSELIELLSRLKDFEFMKTLVLVIKKIESIDKRKNVNFYSNSKAEIIISESDIENVFKSIYTTCITTKIFIKTFKLVS